MLHSPVVTLAVEVNGINLRLLHNLFFISHSIHNIPSKNTKNEKREILFGYTFIEIG